VVGGGERAPISRCLSFPALRYPEPPTGGDAVQQEDQTMPFQTCPSFASCACNDGPLAPASALRGGTRIAVEGEEPCRATRATRERIAAANGIDPAAVVLPRERRSDAARRAWESLPLEVRERCLGAGAGTRLNGPKAARGPVSSVEQAGGGVE
jgi:hypothetical protein